MDLNERSVEERNAAALAAAAGTGVPEVESDVYVASQWQLIWWKFRDHRLALYSGVLLILLYGVAVFVEPLAPSLPGTYNAQYTYAPPQRVHLFYEGRLVRPYVFGLTQEIEQEALRRVFTVDETTRIPLGLFVRGDPYKLWGIIASDLHLFGPVDSTQVVHLAGADRLGRDVLSRMIYGTRISMSIGLVGVALSFVLGTILGGVSGYYGGVIDEAIQRVIEFLRSIPTIPLWMGLAAAVPTNWPPLRIYFAITVILSIIGWTGLARSVRGRFLALREEDFVVCARLDNASEMRVILRHMVPSFASHMIASITLAIPGMILSETSLSFLGLGLQPPVVSWGVLLQDAQNIRAVSSAPWLLSPALLVVVTVLTLNFLGDGLRDAADPYGR
ncbi:MAG: ABC transporter permease [Chloroflexi bacterium]|nr:ABC transporter permease [Chloroflexota bacterium]